MSSLENEDASPTHTHKKVGKTPTLLCTFTPSFEKALRNAHPSTVTLVLELLVKHVKREEGHDLVFKEKQWVRLSLENPGTPEIAVDASFCLSWLKYGLPFKEVPLFTLVRYLDPVVRALHAVPDSVESLHAVNLAPTTHTVQKDEAQRPVCTFTKRFEKALHTAHPRAAHVIVTSLLTEMRRCSGEPVEVEEAQVAWLESAVAALPPLSVEAETCFAWMIQGMLSLEASPTRHLVYLDAGARAFYALPPPTLERSAKDAPSSQCPKYSRTPT